MVYTEPAPRRLQFLVAPAMSALQVHHFGGYSKITPPQKKQKTKKQPRYIKLVIQVEPHASAVSLLKRAENSAIYKLSSIKLQAELSCLNGDTSLRTYHATESTVADRAIAASVGAVGCSIPLTGGNGRRSDTL